MDASLGLESGTVRLVPYDERWPGLFQAEAARIVATLAPLELVVEHTGSTAVPGLTAKPVLDILAGYKDPAILLALITGLQRAGYLHRGPQGIPDREFFRRGNPRSYHLHLTQVGSQFWSNHLSFRDHLRTDSALRDSYAALKLQLAARHPNDREAYIEGKSEFVRAVLAKERRNGEA